MCTVNGTLLLKAHVFRCVCCCDAVDNSEFMLGMLCVHVRVFRHARRQYVYNTELKLVVTYYANHAVRLQASTGLTVNTVS